MSDPSVHNHGVSQAILRRVVDELSAAESFETVLRRRHYDVPMPSVEALDEVVELLRQVLFPGYFGPSELRPATAHFYLGAALDRVTRLLSEQVTRGFCFDCTLKEKADCAQCLTRANRLTGAFLEALPSVRRSLVLDATAGYEGDPAATSTGEAIYCYPSLRAMTNYRVAHELHRLGIPLIPRIITESAHSLTGIDIHPGAQIGTRFFMDHGTGIVIGETSEIGSNVRIYQGVTLGARSFPLNADGNPIKGIPRHPIVEDDVIVYSGATILGRVRIGRGAVIGGNVWLTHDVPPGARIQQGQPEQVSFEQGEGI